MSEQKAAKLAGVMGWPVEHSRSPALHGFWLKQHHIDGAYMRLPVKPGDLGNALQDLHRAGFVGVNLTVPHKEAALAFMDSVSSLAKRIGAVNTVFVGADGRLTADNTDVFGFMENLRTGVQDFDAAAGPAVVLGAGGAARAVCVGLLDAGAPEVRLYNRTPKRAEVMARDIGGNISVHGWDARAQGLKDAALVVNTTTLGMNGQPSLDMTLDALSPAAVVTDIVYAPLETPLLAAAKARGNRTVDGIGMLLYQAQPAFAAWFGVKPAVTPELKAHVLAAG